MDGYRDHGHGKEALTVGLDDAKEILGTAKRLGLNLDGASPTRWWKDGLRQFAKAADDLLGAVAAKRNTMLGDALATVTTVLPEDMGKAVEQALDSWREAGNARFLGATGLGLDRRRRSQVARLARHRGRSHRRPAGVAGVPNEVKAAGFTDVLLARNLRIGSGPGSGP